MPTSGKDAPPPWLLNVAIAIGSEPRDVWMLRYRRATWATWLVLLPLTLTLSAILLEFQLSTTAILGTVLFSGVVLAASFAELAPVLALRTWHVWLGALFAPALKILGLVFVIATVIHLRTTFRELDRFALWNYRPAKAPTLAADAVPRPQAATAVKPEASDGSLVAWRAALDEHLAQTGLPTRSEHFDPGALRFGHAHGMDPATFIRSGYKENLTEATYLMLVSANDTGSSDERRVPSDQPLLEMDGHSRIKPLRAEFEPAPQTAVDGPVTFPPRSEIQEAPPAAVDSLDLLFQLFRSGAISEEEFRALKQKHVDNTLSRSEQHL